VITPLGGEDYWFECTWWMEEPGKYIPFCDILHLGVLFDVDYKNIIIDVVSWWTRDGVPVGGKAAGALYNNGYAPVIGFNVEDLADPQVMTVANGFVTGTRHRRLVRRLRPGHRRRSSSTSSSCRWPHSMRLTRRILTHCTRAAPAESFPWVNIVRADASGIQHRTPLSIDPGVRWRSCLATRRAPRRCGLSSRSKIEPGGFLVIREQAGFTNNSGEYETQCFWEIHGAQPNEACCLPDGACQMLQPFFCLEQGGTPMGAGTSAT